MNIGPYSLVGEIGRGGMGVVAKAIDSRNGQIVAIKLIKRTGIWDERSRIALVREARFAKNGSRKTNMVSP